jgi:hypothetical protein
VWVQANKDKTLKAAGPQGAEDFAHAPGNDKSKWKMPIHDKPAVRTAMSTFHKSDIPDSGKPAAAKKIVNKAQNMGIDPSGFAKSQGLTIDTDDDTDDVDSTVSAGGPGSGPRKGGGSVDHKNLTSKDAAFQSAARDFAAKHSATVDSSTTRTDAARQKSGAANLQRHELTVSHNGNQHTVTGNTHQEVFDKMHQKILNDGTLTYKSPFDGTKTVHTKVTAGGPGSGPRPGGGTNDHMDDGNHNKATSKSDPKDGYGDGQKDPYGYVHDDAKRDAVVGEFKKNGFSDSEMAPAVHDRGLRQMSKTSGTNTEHGVTVFPDGSFKHASGPYREHTGKGVSDVQVLNKEGDLDAAAWQPKTGKGVADVRKFLASKKLLRHKSFASKLLN